MAVSRPCPVENREAATKGGLEAAVEALSGVDEKTSLESKSELEQGL